MTDAERIRAALVAQLTAQLAPITDEDGNAEFAADAKVLTAALAFLKQFAGELPPVTVQEAEGISARLKAYAEAKGLRAN